MDGSNEGKLVFSGSFTQQEPISDEAISAAVEVLRSGRLHRYNLSSDEPGETALLEHEFAKWQGRDYCLAVTSGGQAMQIALRAIGVEAGDLILSNAFTLAPVPGAIHNVGAKPILVEVDKNLRIDLQDFENKAILSGAKYLLLSHMRGHVCDMDRLMDIADRLDIVVIEDCAHTMGAAWNGVRSGNHGRVACFSTQTYKHINSGEGGLLVSDDAQLMANATVLSGSYMLFERHGAGPDVDAYSAARLLQPNGSARMDHLRASILRPQLRDLARNVTRWNTLYEAVVSELSECPLISLPQRPGLESMVGSSIQFRIESLEPDGCERFLSAAADRGVELKWFGRAEPLGFTSSHHSWKYVDPQQLPQTDLVLRTLFDMRLPLTFSSEDCKTIGRIIKSVANDPIIKG